MIFKSLVDVETGSVGLCPVEQVHRVLPGLQHVGRPHPRSHGQAGVRVVTGKSGFALYRIY